MAGLDRQKAHGDFRKAGRQARSAWFQGRLDELQQHAHKKDARSLFQGVRALALFNSGVPKATPSLPSSRLRSLPNTTARFTLTHCLTLPVRCRCLRYSWMRWNCVLLWMRSRLIRQSRHILLPLLSGSFVLLSLCHTSSA